MDRPGHPPTNGTLLAVAWLAVTLIPTHNFIQRSNAAAVSAAGVEPLVEIAYFGCVGVVALTVIRAVDGSILRSRPPVPILLVPIWFALSGLWSETGTYAIVRSGQMLVIAVLGWATLSAGRNSPVGLEHVVRQYLRGFLGITAVLTLLGLTLGPVLVPASDANRERFTWIGAHPNGSGLVLALAIIVLAAAPRSLVPAAPPTRLLLGCWFGALLYDNQSRAAWICLLVGGATALLVAARRQPRLRLWLPLVAFAGGAGLVVAFSAVQDYALRGQQASSLATGNGRLGLWPIGFRALESPADWLLGLGYGAARTVFVAEKAWARTAHSSILSMLVSGGIVALTLFAVLLWSLARSARATRFLATSPTAVVSTALVVAVLIDALATDIVAEPNLGFAVLCLFYAVVVAHEPAGVSGQSVRGAEDRRASPARS